MNIDIDVDGIDAAQLMLGKQPNAIKRAMSSSINRALTAGRTALSKGIRSEYNIKAGTIKGATKSEKATAASGKGVITVTGRPMDLMAIKLTWRAFCRTNSGQLFVMFGGLTHLSHVHTVQNFA